MEVNFSGNRGYHVHVSSNLVYKLNADARKGIANYIACRDIELTAFFPALGVRGVRLDGPKPTDAGWGGKLANAVIVALNKGPDALMSFRIRKICKHALQEQGRDNTRHNDRQLGQGAHTEQGAVLEQCSRQHGDRAEQFYR